MTDDAQLLRHYVENRSESAFAQLVQRHLGLVYFSALRQLGSDAHLAEDVTQSVFALLAGKSPSLLGHTRLVGWLHTTTRFKVAEFLRAEQRRRRRETAVHAMQELANNDSSADEWERLRPILDEVLLELNERDREAVLLRFFGNRSFADIGAQMSLTEKTAHKRVERALQRLHDRLLRRGVSSTTAALSIFLGSQTALAAPAGLASSVTSAVMASSFPTAIAAGVIPFMSIKTTAAVVAIALVLSSGVAVHHIKAARDAAAALMVIDRETAELQTQLRSEQARVAGLAQTKAATSPLPAPQDAKTASRPKAATGLKNRDEGRAFLKANPAVREALAAAYHATLKAEYNELIAALGLTEAETEEFLTIEMNSSTRIVGNHQLNLAESEPTWEAKARQLRELLGAARYQRYREFEEAAPARDLTTTLIKSLYFTPTPLTPSQIDQLKIAVLQAMSDPSVGKKYTGSVWGYIPNPVWDQIFSRVDGLLAPSQVAALRDLHQQSRFEHAQVETRAATRARTH